MISESVRSSTSKVDGPCPASIRMSRKTVAVFNASLSDTFKSEPLGAAIRTLIFPGEVGDPG